MAVDCICRGLTFISFETNEPTPDLAKSWTISDDQLTYTFALREGVKFHDGTTLTSADVLASLGRQFDEKDKTLPKGATRPLSDLGANVASLTAPDDLTVKMVLKKPDRTALGQLSDIGGRIISKAALKKYGADIGKHLVGTGPFAFSAATSGQSITLTAFDDFRLGRPPVDRLVLRQVQDPSTIVSSLLSGDISATQFTPYSAAAQLRKDDSVTVYKTPYNANAILMIDARRVPELKVRQAINLAIDRKSILDQAFYGVGALPGATPSRPRRAATTPASPTSARRTSPRRRSSSPRRARAAGVSGSWRRATPGTRRPHRSSPRTSPTSASRWSPPPSTRPPISPGSSTARTTTTT